MINDRMGLLEIMQVILSNIQTDSNFIFCQIFLRIVVCYIWHIWSNQGNHSQIRDKYWHIRRNMGKYWLIRLIKLS